MGTTALRGTGTQGSVLGAAGSMGLKEVLQDPFSCLQRGVQKQPHHLWPSALHIWTSPQELPKDRAVSPP